MTALGMLFAVLAPFVIGLLLLSCMGVRWRDDRLAVPAWAWLLGCLLLGGVLQLFVHFASVMPPEPGRSVWWVLPLPVISGLGWVRNRLRHLAPAPAPEPASHPIGLPFILFVLAGVVLCLLFAAAGMDRPCIEGDEGNIWSLKAKSLLVDWHFGFAAAQVHNLHPDYPQLNPLLQAWAYSLTGVRELVQFENRWPVQLCNVALFVAVAAALRRRLPPLPAAALASLLLLEPEFQSLCRTAYADGMVALGLVVAVDAFLRWRDGGERRFGWLAGLALGFALWSKNETMLYLACAGVAAVVTRCWLTPIRGGFSRGNLALLVPSAITIANTAVWNARFGMKSDLLGANPTGKSMFTLMAEQWPERVPALGAEAAGVLASTAHAHVVFALLLLGAVCAPCLALGRHLALPVLALLGAFVGLHVVYVGSFLPLRMHLDTSYTRVTFQLLPAAFVLLAALASDVVAARRLRHTAGSP